MTDALILFVTVSCVVGASVGLTWAIYDSFKGPR